MATRISSPPDRARRPARRARAISSRNSAWTRSPSCRTVSASGRMACPYRVMNAIRAPEACLEAGQARSPSHGSPEVHLGQDDGAARVAVVVLGAEREDAAHDLLGGPRDGRDGGDAQALVDLRAPRVVDAGDDLLDAVGLARDAGGEDVAVVAAADGREGLGARDARGLEGLAVEADAGDGLAGELGAELAEGSWRPGRRRRPNGPSRRGGGRGGSRLDRSRGSRCARSERYTPRGRP